MKKKIIRTALVFLVFLESVLFVNYFQSQINLTKILNGSKDQNTIISFFTGLPYERPFSEAIIKIYNDGERNCQNLNFYTDQLLNSNNRNSAALYIKGVCSEISGDLISARTFIEDSLVYDRYNPDYLYGLAVIEYKLGNFASSKKTIQKYKKISSDSQQIEPLVDLLVGK